MAAMRLRWRGSRCCTTTIEEEKLAGSAFSTSLRALRPPADEAIATISKVEASGGSRSATCPLGISRSVRLWRRWRGNVKVARARFGVSAYVGQLEHSVKPTFPRRPTSEAGQHFTGSWACQRLNSYGASRFDPVRNTRGFRRSNQPRARRDERNVEPFRTAGGGPCA